MDKTVIDLATYRANAADAAQSRHCERILELQEMLVPNLVEDEDGYWVAVDEQAAADVADWMRMFGLDADQLAKASDFLLVWNAINVDYGVTLLQFMNDRPAFDASLKSQLPELVEYFEAIVNADYKRTREIATAHQITEKLLRDETPPLVYDAWSNKK